MYILRICEVVSVWVCVCVHMYACAKHVDSRRQFARVCAPLLSCRPWELNSSGQNWQWAPLNPNPFCWSMFFHCDAQSRHCVGAAQSLTTCLSFFCLLFLYFHFLNKVIYVETQDSQPKCKLLKHLLPGERDGKPMRQCLQPPCICFLQVAYRILIGLSWPSYISTQFAKCKVF